MIIANNIEEIEREFDFTDSIIIDVKWINNLTDLLIGIDYYWDIQDAKSQTRELALIFKDCLKADFCINNNLLLMPKEEINFDSWNTIVLFKRVPNNQGLHQININTFDYSIPWAKIFCKEVILEQR
ncbi:hypothetical protein EHV15_31800 [Paenibacillus oralis]|uniref:Uncharacterized protein n=1 Tax=Paenibacillus oralis TaxID=2490856 RepID=A0A3P3UE56_9BACL|nr:hypothetical protein EHV15_31800 [Paenibacillus oralis]